MNLPAIIKDASTIWKLQFKIADTQEIELPAGARILCVQIQHGIPCLWALVNPDNERITRTLYVRGTGHPCGEEIERSTYIGTIQLYTGSLIFHVFEEFK